MLTPALPATDLGERPYPCDLCHNAFARSDLLKRHQASCGTAKPTKPHKPRGAGGKKTMPTDSSPEAEADLSPPAFPSGATDPAGREPSAGSTSSSLFSPSGSGSGSGGSPLAGEESSASSVESPVGGQGVCGSASLLTREMARRVYPVPSLDPQSAYVKEMSATGGTTGIFLGVGQGDAAGLGSGAGNPWGMGAWAGSGSGMGTGAGAGAGGISQRELTAGELEAHEVLEVSVPHSLFFDQRGC